MATSGIHVLIIDDDDALLADLGEWLEVSGYRVLRAHNGSEAIALARSQPIEVAVMDFRLPGFSGLEVRQLLKQLDERIEVIFLAANFSAEEAVLALRHGQGFDFLRKPLKDPLELNLSIEKALVRRHLLVPRGPGGTPMTETPTWYDALTPREREILAYLIAGAENKHIAERVGVSQKTIRNHLSHIYEKLGVANRTQAVIACKRGGLG